MDPIVSQRQKGDVEEEGDNPLEGMEYPCQAPRDGGFGTKCQGTMSYDPDAFAFVCDECGNEEALL